MKPPNVALLLATASLHHPLPFLGPSPIVLADARKVGSPDALLNPVVEFSDLAVRWVQLSERGPTISGHFMVHVHAALFDAWAAFEEGTTGSITDLDDVRVEGSSSNGSSSNKDKKRSDMQIYAMTEAAYEVITVMGDMLLDPKFLEVGNGEIYEEALAEVTTRAAELREELLGSLNVKNVDDAQDVAAAVSSAILAKIQVDGSNFQNDYADTTGYRVTPWAEPEPEITSPRTDYTFVDRSWFKKFNTFDAPKAIKTPNSGLAQLHPDVATGGLKLTTTYQSLTQHGIFPPDADGGEQFPLTPHWGNNQPFSVPSSDALRAEILGPYDPETGELRGEWVEEHREIVELSMKQQDGACPTCRAESEYWELGDEFPYPPGWWVQRATQIAREEEMNLEDSLKVVFGTAITVFDSGVTAWESKYYYDSVRPFTTINEMFEGSDCPDWRGPQKCYIDDKQHWRPYQLRRNTVPPFPEAPSGHSTFSTSSSVVLRSVLDTNVFDYTTEPFKSRFDTEDGFNGDPNDGNEAITLSWKTFSQAADAAGFSRLLGGIHPMSGNIVGLVQGTRVGHMTVSYLRTIFGDPDLGRDPVDDVMNNIVFGTGKDDDSLVAPCKDSVVEVYGFYGDDVLEVTDQGNNCGPISLFGGDNADTFIIGAFATIQDYETKDTIELPSGTSDSITTALVNGVTIVSAGGEPVVAVDGVWQLDDLNIHIPASS